MTQEELKNIFIKYNLSCSSFCADADIYFVKPDIHIGKFVQWKEWRGTDKCGIKFFNIPMTILNPIAIENILNKRMPSLKRKLVDMKIEQISKDFE